MEYVIGVDLGGTNLKAGALTPDGEILFKKSSPSGINEGRDAAIKRILSIIEDVRFHVRGLRLAGIGFGVPGTVIFSEGTVVQSPNLPGWDGFNVRSELAARLPWPLFVDNDANLFALGEGWVGAAEGVKDFCCLTLGTGVGGGVVFGERLWRGVDGTAGEIGHLVVEPEGLPCNCGGRGCLEMYASATALVRMARDGSGDSACEPLLRRCDGSFNNITADVIADMARFGDMFCKGLFERLAGYLGIGMTDLVNLLNVEMVVIGGGLSQSSDLFLESARAEMLRRAFKVPAERVKVAPARLGKEGGMVGAAFMALKETELL